MVGLVPVAGRRPVARRLVLAGLVRPVGVLLVLPGLLRVRVVLVVRRIWPVVVAAPGMPVVVVVVAARESLAAQLAAAAAAQAFTRPRTFRARSWALARTATAP
jgi:hypothetical protein